MDFREAFKILEIEPTDDNKKIKVAYSKILKKYHPEDFPEMFMRINEAYEKALEYGGEDFQEEFFGNEEEFEEYEYEGFSKLIAYIKEQRFFNNTDFNNPDKLKKFHIAYNCKVLNDARKENKASKYKIVLNKKPKFLMDIFFNGSLMEKDVEKELKVCQFCLDALHYKGYDYKKMSYKSREEFVNNFSFEEFLGEEFDKNEKDFKD